MPSMVRDSIQITWSVRSTTMCSLNSLSGKITQPRQPQVPPWSGGNEHARSSNWIELVKAVAKRIRNVPPFPQRNRKHPGAVRQHDGLVQGGSNAYVGGFGPNQFSSVRSITTDVPVTGAAIEHLKALLEKKP